MEDKIITYKGKIKKGYLGGYGTEWWTDSDWKNHKKFVQDCIEDGTYGNEIEIELSMVYYPEFDNPTKPNKNCESYRYTFLKF